MSVRKVSNAVRSLTEEEKCGVLCSTDIVDKKTVFVVLQKEVPQMIVIASLNWLAFSPQRII